MKNFIVYKNFWLCELGDSFIHSLAHRLQRFVDITKSGVLWTHLVIYGHLAFIHIYVSASEVFQHYQNIWKWVWVGFGPWNLYTQLSKKKKNLIDEAYCDKLLNCNTSWVHIVIWVKIKLCTYTLNCCFLLIQSQAPITVRHMMCCMMSNYVILVKFQTIQTSKVWYFYIKNVTRCIMNNGSDHVYLHIEIQFKFIFLHSTFNHRQCHKPLYNNLDVDLDS